MSLLGETWLQLGDSEEAHKWAEKAHLRLHGAEVMSLLGETWLQLGDSEEALKWAEKAHARAGLLGDHWLHSRVLRSLERLLLRFPEKAKKAQAALTIRTARAKAAAQATEQAIGSANHQKVRAWRIRWQ
ncbi:hypothetical protein T484DRAFT_1805737 [Baffinella frigidus]|nr:hypothetical protein T484DRAFT_1805737 [Cryptophyta sp. CCMP2293]